jgi:metal-responsive CopG/Arc/MetJ family transcriptional regulator|tara:strand:+ start:310 stop:450 length:141 start_codon:yes stop_codon:yes gene_type:complete
MKEKLSVTVDKETIARINEIMQTDFFRNKSHLVELAIKRYLKEVKK